VCSAGISCLRPQPLARGARGFGPVRDSQSGRRLPALSLVRLRWQGDLLQGVQPLRHRPAESTSQGSSGLDVGLWRVRSQISSSIARGGGHRSQRSRSSAWPDRRQSWGGRAPGPSGIDGARRCCCCGWRPLVGPASRYGQITTELQALAAVAWSRWARPTGCGACCWWILRWLQGLDVPPSPQPVGTVAAALQAAPGALAFFGDQLGALAAGRRGACAEHGFGHDLGTDSVPRGARPAGRGVR